MDFTPSQSRRCRHRHRRRSIGRGRLRLYSLTQWVEVVTLRLCF